MARAARGGGTSSLTDDQKARLRSQKDAQPKGVIANVTAPALNLGAVTEEVDELVGRSIVAHTIDELTCDPGLAAWVQRGLALHSGEHASETCRFCQQPLEISRRSALEAHFNDAFATFQQDLARLLSKLEAGKQSVSSMRLPETSRFYDHLVADATAAIESLNTALASVATALDTIIARVESKRENPFSPATYGASGQRSLSPLTAGVKSLNAIVDEHNKTTEDFRRSVTEACKKLEAAWVAEACGDYRQLVAAVEAAKEVLNNVKSNPGTIQAEIDTLERQILEHRRPADELTDDELLAYLGRDELRFEVKGSGYALTRGGQPVSHLSEGDRTAIAFLYFLKSLQDKTFDMESGIVVIDDPVSSLDANALFSAFGYMKERTKKCHQLLIFTHSFAFFRLVKNWFHHLRGQQKKNEEDRPARFYRAALSSARGWDAYQRDRPARSPP